MHSIAPSTRLRPSPFHEATLAEGVRGFTVYNHMLMPTDYGDPAAEYHRLLNGVALWDVAVERQVQLAGPDAGRLAQILAPRDLSALRVGEGRYVALCDHAGTLINDQVLLKLAEDRFWLSIADSDALFWARAIAAERRLDVVVTEPDVSPLAVRGPHAEAVAAAMFGDWVRGLKRFRFTETAIEGIPVQSNFESGSMALNDLEPAHGGLQKMVVIVRHGLSYERGDLVIGETGLPCSLAAPAEYYKGVAVMPSKRNGDVGVFWRHSIGSSRQSMRQQA